MIALVAIFWIIVTTVVGYVAIVAVLSEYGNSTRGWFSTVVSHSLEGLEKTDTWTLLIVNVVVVIGTQILFLLPVFRFKPELGGRKSLRTSMVVAGFGAAILTTSLLMGVVCLVQLITGSIDEFPMTLYLDAEGAVIGEILIRDKFSWIFVVSLVVLGVSWFCWSLVLIAFVARRNMPQAIRRVTGLLVAGTLLEILLVLPLEAMVRRRAECYCGTGSFQMLLGAVFAGTWLLGPGIFVLFVLRRPAYWGRYCPDCGYEKGPRSMQPKACPECGRAWQDGPGPAG